MACVYTDSCKLEECVRLAGIVQSVFWGGESYLFGGGFHIFALWPEKVQQKHSSSARVMLSDSVMLKSANLFSVPYYSSLCP